MSVAELLQRIQSGREVRRAQEELYSLVRSSLLRRIRARLPARLGARMDAEDILDEAFLKAMKALGSFRPVTDGSFLAWVYTVAKNLIADAGRRRSVAALHFAHGEDEKGPRESRVISQRRSHESQLLRRDLIDRLLERLPPRYAEVIRLRVLKDLSFEEIASVWKSTPGAVQRLYARASDRLRELGRSSSRNR